MPKPIRTSPTTARPTPTSKSRPTVTSAWDRAVPVDFAEDEGITLCVYGRSGTGKTTFWSSFPGPILVAVCSGGKRPGELRSLSKEARGKTNAVVVADSSDMKELIEKQAETDHYRTFVLDHASGLQDKILAEILGLESLPAQKHWGMASQQEYGQCTQQTKEYLRGMLSLRCNVVIVAQERNFKEGGESDDGILPNVGPALTPSLTNWLNPSCDYVVETFIRQREIRRTVTVNGTKKVRTEKTRDVEFCMRTAPDPVFMTKFRKPGGVGESVLVDPTYEKVMSLINGEVVDG